MEKFIMLALVGSIAIAALIAILGYAAFSLFRKLAAPRLHVLSRANTNRLVMTIGGANHPTFQSKQFPAGTKTKTYHETLQAA